MSSLDMFPRDVPHASNMPLYKALIDIRFHVYH
jgi:hypothetical protein